MTILDDLRWRRPQPGTPTKLLERMVSRLAGARMLGDRAVVDVDGDEVPIELRSDGDSLVLVSPTIDTAGATIGVAPQTGHGSRARTARDVAGRLGLAELAIDDGGDRHLTVAWLDQVVREALPQLFWVSHHGSVLCARLFLIGGEVSAAPVSLAGEHLSAIADTVASVATRPRRLARELTAAAASLGGRATSESFALGGNFALAFGELVVDFVRALPGVRGEHLRTRARMPARIDAQELGARIKKEAAFARTVSAASYAVLGDDVVIAVDGIPRDLAPLVQLTARLAGEPASTGPYR